jgi:hypothetical protein
MRSLVTIFFTLLLTSPGYGQPVSISEKGFYIPKNIVECNQQLDRSLLNRAKNKLKQLDENRLSKVSGLFIIGEWFDNDSSQLAAYFNNYSIIDWQERSFIIVLSYHRQLNAKPFDIGLECKKLVQKRDSLKKANDEEYKKNITADSIDGIYIPTDIYSCFSQLDKLLNDTIRQNIREKKSEWDLTEYHMGLGRWMRNNWGLWGGSRLQQYFITKGINHPDDMSGTILVSYNKYLNSQPVDMDEIIKEEKLFQEKFIKKEPAIVIVSKHKKNFYSKEYRKFLRTKRITDFDVYD